MIATKDTTSGLREKIDSILIHNKKKGERDREKERKKGKRKKMLITGEIIADLAASKRPLIV